METINFMNGSPGLQKVLSPHNMSNNEESEKDDQHQQMHVAAPVPLEDKSLDNTIDSQNKIQSNSIKNDLLQISQKVDENSQTCVGSLALTTGNTPFETVSPETDFLPEFLVKSVYGEDNVHLLVGSSKISLDSENVSFCQNEVESERFSQMKGLYQEYKPTEETDLEDSPSLNGLINIFAGKEIEEDKTKEPNDPIQIRSPACRYSPEFMAMENVPFSHKELGQLSPKEDLLPENKPYENDISQICSPTISSNQTSFENVAEKDLKIISLQKKLLLDSKANKGNDQVDECCYAFEYGKQSFLEAEMSHNKENVSLTHMDKCGEAEKNKENRCSPQHSQEALSLLLKNEQNDSCNKPLILEGSGTVKIAIAEATDISLQRIHTQNDTELVEMNDSACSHLKTSPLSQLETRYSTPVQNSQKLETCDLNVSTEICGSPTLCTKVNETLPETYSAPHFPGSPILKETEVRIQSFIENMLTQPQNNLANMLEPLQVDLSQEVNREESKSVSDCLSGDFLNSQTENIDEETDSLAIDEDCENLNLESNLDVCSVKKIRTNYSLGMKPSLQEGNKDLPLSEEEMLMAVKCSSEGISNSQRNIQSTSEHTDVSSPAMTPKQGLLCKPTDLPFGSVCNSQVLSCDKSSLKLEEKDYQKDISKSQAKVVLDNSLGSVIDEATSSEEQSNDHKGSFLHDENCSFKYDLDLEDSLTQNKLQENSMNLYQDSTEENFTDIQLDKNPSPVFQLSKQIMFFSPDASIQMETKSPNNFTSVLHNEIVKAFSNTSSILANQSLVETYNIEEITELDKKISPLGSIQCGFKQSQYYLDCDRGHLIINQDVAMLCQDSFIKPNVPVSSISSLMELTPTKEEKLEKDVFSKQMDFGAIFGEVDKTKSPESSSEFCHSPTPLTSEDVQADHKEVFPQCKEPCRTPGPSTFCLPSEECFYDDDGSGIPKKVQIMDREDFCTVVSDQMVPNNHRSLLKDDIEDITSNNVPDISEISAKSKSCLFSWEGAENFQNVIPVQGTGDIKECPELPVILPLKTCSKQRRIGLSRRQKIKPLHSSFRKSEF